MEIKITTKQLLKVLQVLSWIIFIGLCVEAGGIIVNTFITLFINHSGVNNFWKGSDYLSRLYKFDQGYFITITLTMIIVAVLKAIMFYLIVKLFKEKKLNLSQPFSADLSRFILLLSYLAWGIGIFSLTGLRYAGWLASQGVGPADLQALQIAGADVWLFMAIILVVIVQIVKRGTEIQTENEFTI
jgi:hypothetical protein